MTTLKIDADDYIKILKGSIKRIEDTRRETMYSFPCRGHKRVFMYARISITNFTSSDGVSVVGGRESRYVDPRDITEEKIGRLNSEIESVILSEAKSVSLSLAEFDSVKDVIDKNPTKPLMLDYYELQWATFAFQLKLKGEQDEFEKRERRAMEIQNQLLRQQIELGEDAAKKQAKASFFRIDLYIRYVFLLSFFALMIIACFAAT